ncbi:MAG: filamentous hemagglutinin family protein [Thiobacillus sp.]
MNRNRYRLIFSTSLGMMVPVAETARRQGKATTGSALALAGVLLAGPVQAELPFASSGGAIPNFVTQGNVKYVQPNGPGGVQAYINQVGNKSILNWKSFNISPGHNVQFQQVDSHANNALVQGANFTSLNRIWDINPSVIAGSISQAAGQKANVILVNSNGIAFMGGSQVNLNTFTASTLDMQDRFLDTFLPQGELNPQFENALDGSAARGFIKVFEDAKITAGSQGRVILIAPTVVNKGKVAAPDGQIIVAAGSKAYLRSAGGELNGLLIEIDSPTGLNAFDAANSGVADGKLDGEVVDLTDAAEDRLGHATNLGELSTPRGNVTMVGYAVNQMGIARATTSVIANGSVYLMAKDRVPNFVATEPPGSVRAGRVTLGQNSLTEILPEVADTATTQDGAAGTGLDRPSRVRVLGQDIRIEGAARDANGHPVADSGARIVAPSGLVELVAVDNPKTDYFVGGTTDIFGGGSAASTAARVHVGSGARINVAGLRDVEVAAGRSVVEIELRGDELKDSPVNQQGRLRGQKVYLDIDRALAASDAGKPTLVARDTLLNLKAQQQRTVAERSTAGGSFKVYSKGEAIVESGVTVDLSGGSLKHAPGNVKTTLLTSGGKLIDLSDASAEVRYDGIATHYVIDYGRWNRQEVIDLGQSYRYDTGFTEGKDAGSLETFGIGGLYAQPAIVGATVTGERQRDLGIQPRGARWIVGYDDVSSSDKNKLQSDGYDTQDYKLNQSVVLSNAATRLSESFRAGDALPADIKSTLALDGRMLGENRVAELTVLSNQAIAVRDALAAPQGGAIKLTGSNIDVAADIVARAGTVDLTARNTAGQLADALPAPTLTVADGVTISTRGAWVNDLPAAGGRTANAPRLDGGTIRLEAQSISDGPDSFVAQGEVALGRGATLDADGGAWLKANNKTSGGDGGAIAVTGFSVRGLDDANVHAYGVDRGGSLALGSNRIAIGGTPDAAPDVLKLAPDFLSRGGFARFDLNALARLEVAEGTRIAPVLVSRELDAASATQTSGRAIETFSRLAVRDARVRQAVDLNLRARQGTAQTGDLVVGTGARIELDPRAKLVLDGLNRVDIDGLLRAHGGTIAATSDIRATLGVNATLDVSGIAQTYIDNRGLVQGKVLGGGTVDLAASSAVVAEAGSRIDVSGAAPVRLDVPNETGGLGRAVGSAGGDLTVAANGSIRLDGTLAADGGGANLAGGRFEAALGGKFVRPDAGQSLVPVVLELADAVAPGQADGATRLSAGQLERAGFDRIRLASRDAIRIRDGVNVGAGRALPLRELTLDAAAILTDGGNATLRADTLALGNFDPIRVAATAAATTTGTLALDARLLDLVGNFDLGGMAQANLTGTEAIRFSGTTDRTVRPTATLRSDADLAFHGAVVAPASYTQARIVAPGRDVRFTRTTDAPVQPLAALGSLAVEAKDIVQDGNLWAPLGQLEFNASDSLVFKAGSLTSVAAAAGSVLPFGKTQNGREWVVDLDPAKVPEGQIKQDDLDGKAVRVSARSIDMQPGAKVDLSGGGDLQAYEFTVGPGGGRDILADANTYAILPGFAGGFAPADAQEGFDRASGEAVFLSGVPGLADGVYTLLPAHYALLPGAFAVKLDGGAGSVLPGQAFTRQDGIRVAAGFVTDTRAGAPRDPAWQGIQVLTRDQVRARSEFTLTRASDFFAGSFNRPQDAGLLSASTTGSGADALKLDAFYDFAAAPGGRGAKVDISATKLAVVSGTPTGLDPDAVVLDAADLNALGADSLLLGATRTTNGDTTTLDVGATDLVLANDAAHALTGSEVMLAAKDTITLKAGSLVDAQGAAGDAGHYETGGNGAFVRAASTTATFARTGAPDRSAGTLVGEAGSVVAAADSIVLDATKENAFKGTTRFTRKGAPVAGNLAIGATRINFGAAPAGSEGLTFTQTELDAIDLAGLYLISYSTFDLYGDVAVGRLDGNGKPVLQNLTLQGAGLAGIANANTTAQLNAKQLTLTNTAAAKFALPKDDDGNEVVLGSGTLDVTADTLTLGQGDKQIAGFGQVNVTANELVGSGIGKLEVAAPVTLNVARISGQTGASQSLNAAGKLEALHHVANRTLAPVTALGAAWALQGSSVDFKTRVELPSGNLKLAATSGDVTLGANASVDVAGREVQFFDVKKPSWGGTAEFVSTGKIDGKTGEVVAGTGNVDFDDGAKVDVSAAAGGDAGTLVVRAANGRFTLADGSVSGAAPLDAAGQRGEGARADIDVKTLNKFDDEGNQVASFSTVNTALNTGGFDGARALRVRTGDVSIAGTDSVRAHDIRIAADGGKLDVQGTLDASGADAGRIELFAKGDVNVLGKDDAKGLAGAKLLAQSSSAGEDGGDIVVGTREGGLNLATGSDINVSAGSGGQGGTVLLRAPRNGDNTDVAVSSLGSTIAGARSIAVEAVKTYAGKTTLNAGTTDSGATLGLGAITADNAAFAKHHAAIKSDLGRSDVHILSGVEVRSAADLTLGADWNLATARAGGEAGVLTLRADGNLLVGANLSDGFSHATPCTAGACTATGTPATLRSDASWSYRLIAGADSNAADPLAVKAVDKDVTLAAGKLVRTGTGDIDMVAGRNVVLADAGAAIYTAGRLAAPLSGFTLPFANLRAAYTVDGGDVRIAARGDVVGKPSAQLFSQWLYRQGAVDPVTGLYAQQPSWWVRFDQFKQGVGALGGGDVTIAAGGSVRDVSASLPTQAYTVGTKPSDAVLRETGGGMLRVTAGGDVLGGSYYVGRGELDIRAGGRVAAGSEKINPNTAPLAAIIGVGDARADVRATGDVVIGNIVNPHLLPQSAGNLVQPPFGQGLRNPRATLFSTYSANSGVATQSLAGNTRLDNSLPNSSAFPDSLGDKLVVDQATLASGLLPPTLSLVAFLGDVTVGTAATGNLTLSPSASGMIDLFAGSSIHLNSNLALSDMDPRFVPNAASPVGTVSTTATARPVVPSLLLDPFSVLGNIHAATPVHTADRTPARVYAREGDVVGVNLSFNGAVITKVLNVAKAVDVRAGNDVRNLSVFAQHNDDADTSRIQAGRDVVYDSTSDRRDRSLIRIGGGGRVEVTAGRSIDLGTSGGVVSRGNIDNPNLPAGGADIQLAAGVGAEGIDYAGAVARLLKALNADPSDEITLWQARWLTGDESLGTADAAAAVQAVQQLDADTQRARVRDWQFTALRETGQGANQASSGFAGDFSRGYAALALLFPGIEEKNKDGSFKHYEGDINLFASRVKTENGGNVEFFVPGGDVIVGLPNTPAALVNVGSNVLGMVVAGEGDLKGMSRDDMLVNQSRILTVGGGDVLLWSSEGDIDAGKGKKTASAVPPPVVKVDAQGNTTLEQQGAVTGSGIGALFVAGGTAGDVDLIAPKGTVNAGDAGIRAGNLNIAAQVVLGADNISVSGTSTGTPVADTSAVSAASSGASNAGGDVSSTTAALSQNLADAARAAEELKQAFKPTFISAEVIGHGE